MLRSRAVLNVVVTVCAAENLHKQHVGRIAGFCSRHHNDHNRWGGHDLEGRQHVGRRTQSRQQMCRRADSSPTSKHCCTDERQVGQIQERVIATMAAPTIQRRFRQQ